MCTNLLALKIVSLLGLCCIVLALSVIGVECLSIYSAYRNSIPDDMFIGWMQALTSLCNILLALSITGGSKNLKSFVIVQDRASVLFKQVHEGKTLKGRSNDAIASACMYIACRQEGVPRTFKGRHNSHLSLYTHSQTHTETETHTHTQTHTHRHTHTHTHTHTQTHISVACSPFCSVAFHRFYFTFLTNFHEVH
jgi:hypothetical protein